MDPEYCKAEEGDTKIPDPIIEATIKLEAEKKPSSRFISMPLFSFVSLSWFACTLFISAKIISRSSKLHSQHSFLPTWFSHHFINIPHFFKFLCYTGTFTLETRRHKLLLRELCDSNCSSGHCYLVINDYGVTDLYVAVTVTDFRHAFLRKIKLVTKASFNIDSSFLRQLF